MKQTAGLGPDRRIRNHAKCNNEYVWIKHLWCVVCVGKPDLDTTHLRVDQV